MIMGGKMNLNDLRKNAYSALLFAQFFSAYMIEKYNLQYIIILCVSCSVYDSYSLWII